MIFWLIFFVLDAFAFDGPTAWFFETPLRTIITAIVVIILLASQEKEEMCDPI